MKHRGALMEPGKQGERIGLRAMKTRIVATAVLALALTGAAAAGSVHLYVDESETHTGEAGGAPAAITVTLTGNSTVTADGVLLAVWVPGGVSMVVPDACARSYAGKRTLLSCSFGDLEPGKSVAARIEFYSKEAATHEFAIMGTCANCPAEDYRVQIHFER